MMKKERFMAYTPGIVLAMFLMVVIGSCTNPDLGTVESTSSDMTNEQAIATISNISTENLLGKIRITVAADSELSYTAFKLSDPLRLVLDLPNSESSDLSEITFKNVFPLMRITPFQFDDEEKVNSRIEIALTRLVPYQVFNDANKLFIDLETPIKETDLAAAASSLPPGFEELTPVKEASSGVMNPESSMEPLVASTTPAMQPVSMETLEVSETIVIEPLSQTNLSVVTPAQYKESLPTIQIERAPKTAVQVALLPGQKVELPVESSGAVIKDLQISDLDDVTRLTISATTIPEFEIKRSSNPPRVTIDLKHSNLPPGGEKILIPDEMGTTVKQARLFQLRRSPDGTDNVVRILVDLIRPTKHEVTTEPGKLIVNLENQTVFTQAEMRMEDDAPVEVPLTTGIETALEGRPETTIETEIAGEPTIRAPKTGEEREYKGQLISLHFQEADILDVLQVIAEVSGLNLVVHPNVRGIVTVHLTNIPWDQALDIILKMNNLSVEIEGNILRVAQAQVFQNEIAQRIAQQQQQLQARRIQEELEPLATRLITINFAEPTSIVSLIDDYFMGSLSPDQQELRRGTITVDSRTKTLIVQDTADNIEIIEEIVATLDRRTPQVMIEAKIVTLNTLYAKEIGIQWLGTFNMDPQHGNALDYRFPYTVNQTSPGGEQSFFGVNLPGLSVDAAGSTGWLRFGSIDDVVTLFAKIDAAEVDNKGKTLAQPKIFTQDNVAASVTAQQTRTVPSFGDNTQATTVVAPLTLSVTPRISNDGYITMIVNVNNTTFVDTGDTTNLATAGQTLTSQVTVKDGSTVVIGGIFVTQEVDNMIGVPGLSSIPILGHLFKSTVPKAKSQQELLVFLTPRILDRNIIAPELQEGSDISLSY